MLGLNGPMVFEVTVPKQPKSTVKAKQEDDLNLSPAAYLRGHGAKLKQLVERDEDRWRNFIANRAELPSSQRRSNRSPQGFGCLGSEEHTSELQSLMRISYAVFPLKKKNIT